MMPASHGSGENLTLSLAELEAYQGQGAGQRAGKHLRYFCPIHGGDNQRSLSLDPESGRFQCFACGAWGYQAEKREAWMGERRRERAWKPTGARLKPGHDVGRAQKPILVPRQGEEEPKARPDLHALLAEYQQALPGSWGEEYLRRRGIPLGVAQTYGVGYSAAGKWPNPKRDWKWGRLVFPHTTPRGELVNLYGRAVGSNERVPKQNRHDHLPGPKGVFNARGLSCDTVFICEGVLDALSLVAAGHTEPGVQDVCAIFGLGSLRWSWVKAQRAVFAFDKDAAGDKWKELAWQAKLLGKGVCSLPPEAYGPHKDLNEAWVATGKLDIGVWDDAGLVVAVGRQNDSPNTGEIGDLLQRAFAGNLAEPIMLPVAPRYQELLGMSVWVCPDSETAEDKRQELNRPLTFNPEELALILRWVQEDRSSLGVLMQAKKIFGGSFFEK